jgi:hypothetical protein
MNAGRITAKIGCVLSVQRLGNWKRKGSAMSDDPILKCLEYHASAGGEYTYWGEQALIKYAALKADADRLASVLEWYAVQGENCRKHGLEGERARNSLDRDGGSQARAALAAHERGEE